MYLSKDVFMTNMIADEAVAKSRVLSVFDFDGTLTHHDSFIPFLRFAFGKRYFAGRLVLSLIHI